MKPCGTRKTTRLLGISGAPGALTQPVHSVTLLTDRRFNHDDTEIKGEIRLRVALQMLKYVFRLRFAGKGCNNDRTIAHLSTVQ
jgi:hypothetical protein